MASSPSVMLVWLERKVSAECLLSLPNLFLRFNLQIFAALSTAVHCWKVRASNIHLSQSLKNFVNYLDSGAS